ncbi:MAG: hypothetical protein L0196_01445, partial [candidate division Zixibacteria bacterium]|nr:hypothetical protein [candidate division Zixibacteria bacterium]
MKCIPMLLGAGILLLCSTIFAAVPQLINFQGILRDGNGNPVANGSYSVIFTIYDAASGGTNLWTETQSVTTTSGLFSTLLGSVSPIPASVFNDSSRYLGVQVGADPEMTPRQKLSSVGYSHNSSEWTSAGANLFRLNGNVGIGTTSPGYPLHILGGAADDWALYVDNSASTSPVSSEAAAIYGKGGPLSYGVFGRGPFVGVGGKGSAGVFGENDAAMGPYGVLGQATGSGGIGVQGLGYNVGAGDATGVYGLTIRDAGITGTRIGVRAGANDGGFPPVGTPEDFDFYAETPNGKSYFAGNVGIGTTVPTSKLEVKTAGGTNRLTLSSDLSQWNILTFNRGGVTQGEIGLPSTTNDLYFRAGGAERMRIIGNDGSVGIGTTAPGGKL